MKSIALAHVKARSKNPYCSVFSRHFKTSTFSHIEIGFTF